MVDNSLARLIVEVVLSTRRAEIELRNWEKTVSKSASKLERLAGIIGRIGGAASALLLIGRIFSSINDILQESLQNFADLEKQIINIQKISGGSFTQVRDAFFEIVKLNPGVTFHEVADAMAAAARTGLTLGNGLDKITEAGVRFAQVAGDLTPTEAVEGLSTLIQNFNLGADQADNLASAIDTLSDRFKATSGQILKSSARLAGFAQTTKTSANDIAAISTVLLGSGQQPTVVNSSIVRLLTALKTNLFDVTNALNIAGDAQKQFFINFETGQTIEGIIQFVEALEKLPFDEQSDLLQSLGIAGARVRPVIEILKTKVDDLRKAQRTSNEAGAEGVSTLIKQGLQIDSAASRLQILANEQKKFNASIAESNDIINLNIVKFELWKNTIEGFKVILDSISEGLGGGKFTLTDPNLEKFFDGFEFSTNTEKLRENQVALAKWIAEYQKYQNQNPFNFFTKTYLDRLERFADLNQKIIVGIKEAEKLGLDPQTGRKAAELAAAATEAGKNFGEEVARHLKRALKDSISQFTSILGQPGQLLALGQRLTDLAKNPLIKQNPVIGGLFGQLAQALIEDFGNKQNQRQTGLQSFTEIWKKAVFDTEKKAENVRLLRLQVDFTRELIRLMGQQNGFAAALNDKLDQLINKGGLVLE